MSMNNCFNSLFVKREQSLKIEQTANDTITKCWFAGNSFLERESAKYIHFITFSKECFSNNKSQKYLSVFVNPETELPNWLACNYSSIPFLENAMEFNLNLLSVENNEEGSKIGGKPYYIRGAQANLFEQNIEPENAKFILSLDEEDFFPIQIPTIDKVRRDILCGGAIYLYAKINECEQVLDFSKCWIDQHI